MWINAPLAGLAQHLAGSSWTRDVVAIALVGAAVLLLLPATQIALSDAEQLLQRLSVEGALSERLVFLHTRFGTPSGAIDVAAASTILVMLVSSGRVSWLAHAYAMAIVATLALKIAALVRLRRLQPGGQALPGAAEPAHRCSRDSVRTTGCHPAGRCRSSGDDHRGDAPAIATFALMGSLMLLFTGGNRENLSPVVAEDADSFDVLPAAELSLDQMDARPGNVLALVRNPHSLAHVASALQTPRDRDVVAMTVRLLGVDVSADGFNDATPTPAERRLLSEVATLAERHDCPVRLLVVPAHNVFDAIVATVLRLRLSDVHVGESSTLSADEQARLLGSAWERAARAEPLDVRLVVHHRSGRTDTYHLGAHPPSLSPAISTSFIVSGSTRRRSSGRMCTITMSSEQRLRKWNSN